VHETNSFYGWWTPRRVSFAFMTTLIVSAPFVHLATVLLTILFSCFLLQMLDFGRGKWLSVLLFCGVVALISYGFVAFFRNAASSLPPVFQEFMPKLQTLAASKGVDLPFEDIAGLKALITKEVQERFAEVTNIAKLATREAVLFIIGLVVAVSIFLKPALDLAPSMHRVPNNLYSAFCAELMKRFESFFESFRTVLGAQIIISSVNTALTAVFILSASMKHSIMLIGVTFLCGLLPIIGNLISNCVIFAVGLTMSPTMAIAALAYLIIIHKFEYFLNSKIIGDRIRNPVWLTMLGLIVGEKFMGIPGMILAPVVLYYIKLEMGAIAFQAPPATSDSPDAPPAPSGE